MKYSGHRKLLCDLSNYQNSMLLTSSDTKRTLRHPFLFTNFGQRELVSVCTQTAINFSCITFLHSSMLMNDRNCAVLLVYFQAIAGSLYKH